MVEKPEQENIIVYPCLNGDRIVLNGTPCPFGGEHQDKQYWLYSRSNARKITAYEAQNIMADEGFFEPLPGDCPATASGVIDTDSKIQTGF